MNLHKKIINATQEKEIRSKWISLSNDQLYDHLKANFNYEGCKTSIRTFLYSNGLRKTNCLRWKPDETKYLLDNYKLKGNIEISKKLTSSKRKVTKKNVEKKMKLLKIKRTTDELDFIRNKAKKKGVYSKANFKKWEDKKIPENETTIQVRNGRPIVMVKINESLTPYARHRYMQINGLLEPGMRVHFKDCNPLNVSDDNLDLRKGCAYSGYEIQKYNRFCREYIIKNKFLEKTKVTSEKVTKNKIFKGMVTVRINDKTTIQVKPGTNIEMIKEKYGIQRMLSNAKQ